MPVTKENLTANVLARIVAEFLRILIMVAFGIFGAALANPAVARGLHAYFTSILGAAS